MLLGTDGMKLSKSRRNAIELRASPDETAALIRRARTDAARAITYDPVGRPEVANLLLIAALCTDDDPVAIAESIGDRGAGALKHLVTDAVNDHLQPLRRRRTELADDPEALRAALARGNDRANDLADATLSQVREAMGMTY